MKRDLTPEVIEEACYFNDRAADAMLHLDRAKAARLRASRSKEIDYGAMGDEYTALAQVQLIIREFKQSGIEVPEYVREAWRAQIMSFR